MKINNIHSGIARYISKSEKIQRVLKSVEKNPSLATGVIAGTIAVALKPLTLAVLPVKSKEEKKDIYYSSSRSITTGIIDLVMAYAVFIPLNKQIDISGRNFFNNPKNICYKNKELTSNAKSILNRGAKIAFVPIFAWLKFLWIDPLAKKMIGDKK